MNTTDDANKRGETQEEESDTMKRFRARAAQLAERAVRREELRRRGLLPSMNLETAKFMVENGYIDEHWVIGRSI